MTKYKKAKKYRFWKMIGNTLSISLYSLATFPCAIILALLLNEVRSLRFKKTVQMVTYAPYFLSKAHQGGLHNEICHGIYWKLPPVGHVSFRAEIFREGRHDRGSKRVEE